MLRRKKLQRAILTCVKKEKDDELGALCDSINDMAAELGTAEKMETTSFPLFLHLSCARR